MNNYLSSSDLRDLAKRKMEGCYVAAIMLMVFGFFMSSCFEYFWTNIFAMFGGNMQNPISTATLICSLVTSIFVGVFDIGYAYFYLNIYCGQPFRLGNLMYGFQNHLGTSLGLSAFFSSIRYLCTVPAKLFYYQYAVTQKTSDLTIVFLSLTISIVVYLITFLCFNLSIYILLDFPDKTPLEVLSLSFKLMKGNYLRLLYLVSTFIPYGILGIMSFGIGFIWIIPFYSMTRVAFFMDIMNSQPSKANTIDIAV